MLLDKKAKLAYHDHAYVDSGTTRSISPVIKYFDPTSLKQLRTLVIIHVGDNDPLLATSSGSAVVMDDSTVPGVMKHSRDSAGPGVKVCSIDCAGSDSLS